VEECGVDVTGCNSWVTVGACILAAGEHCELGVCIPQCQDVCVEGSGRCTNGAPQECQRVGTGCTAWTAKPACGANSLCVDGTCHAACGGGELESCPAGQVCTGTTAGSACLADPSAPVADAGTSGTGGGSGSGTTSGTGGTSGAAGSGGVVSTGAGCASVGGEAMSALAVLAWVLTRRRQRA
jgi:uncharacterized protein (TIGR03382 family)